MPNQKHPAVSLYTAVMRLQTPEDRPVDSTWSLYIHSFIHFLLLYPVRGRRGAGAYPSIVG